jgi:hypothetical protein
VEREDPGQRVAVRGVARVPDVDGPVGLDETNSTFVALRAGRAAGAEAVAGREQVAQRVGVPRVGQEEVQEAGAGDLGAVEPGAEPAGQLLGQPRRDVPRRGPHERRVEHRRVRREVAELRLLGAFERRPGARRRALDGDEGVGRGLDGAAEQFNGGRLTGEDLVCTIELLEQDDPRELVRQRHPAERELVVAALELQPAERPADDQAQVLPGLPALLQPPREGHRVVGAPAVVEQGDERPVGDAPRDLLVLADLDEIERHVPGEELGVVLDVVLVGRAQTADGEDGAPHLCDPSPMAGDPDAPGGRHINIHFSPEIMAGVYANFANVSHSDYEFTVTFARVDHEVEEEEVRASSSAASTSARGSCAS